MNSNTVCVDASLAAKWVLWEEDHEKALDLLERWRNQEMEIVVPPHLPIEVANAIYQRMRRKDLTPVEARHVLQKFLQLQMTIMTPKRLYQNAFSLARRLQLTSLYDAHHLSLADSMRCEFWTADEKLYGHVHHTLPWVKSIGKLAFR